MVHKIFQIFLSVLFAAFLFIIPNRLAAGSRDFLFHQGLLFNPDGSSVEGGLNLTFRIYGEESGGTPLWEELQTVVLEGGSYNATLGEIAAFPEDLFNRETLYLGVQVGEDSEMSPRLGLFSVPFAQQAEVAVTALSLQSDIVTSDSIAPGAITSSDIAAGAVGPVELAASGVTPGTYALSTVTVDAAGRITSAASGSAGDVTGVTAGTGLSGGGAAGEVSLSSVLGTAIESSEIADDSILNADINVSAAIAGSKVNPDFGSQDVVTTGDIEAAGGYKMMIGPFQETDVAASVAKSWEIIEGVGPDEVPMPWGGSVIGVSVKCKPGSGVTAGTLTVEPTIDGVETDLEAVLTSAAGSNKHKTAAQAKDTDVFSGGQLIGCKGTSASLSPTTLDCVCMVFVEM